MRIFLDTDLETEKFYVFFLLRSTTKFFKSANLKQCCFQHFQKLLQDRLNFISLYKILSYLLNIPC